MTRFIVLAAVVLFAAPFISAQDVAVQDSKNLNYIVRDVTYSASMMINLPL